MTQQAVVRPKVTWKTLPWYILGKIATFRAWVIKKVTGVPGYPAFEKNCELWTRPVRQLADSTLRAFPGLQKVEWALEVGRLKALHPVVLAISLAFAIYRGLMPTKYGHIGTDLVIYPLLTAFSMFNPFLGFCCGVLFALADFVQKIVYNDIFGTQGRDANYFGAMAGYLIAYSSVLMAGVVPGVTSRVSRLGIRLALRAIFFRKAAATGDGATPGGGHAEEDFRRGIDVEKQAHGEPGHWEPAHPDERVTEAVYPDQVHPRDVREFVDPIYPEGARPRDVQEIADPIYPEGARPRDVQEIADPIYPEGARPHDVRGIADPIYPEGARPSGGVQGIADATYPAGGRGGAHPAHPPGHAPAGHGPRHPAAPTEETPAEPTAAPMTEEELRKQREWEEYQQYLQVKGLQHRAQQREFMDYVPDQTQGVPDGGDVYPMPGMGGGAPPNGAARLWSSLGGCPGAEFPVAEGLASLFGGMLAAWAGMHLASITELPAFMWFRPSADTSCLALETGTFLHGRAAPVGLEGATGGALMNGLANPVAGGGDGGSRTPSDGGERPPDGTGATAGGQSSNGAQPQDGAAPSNGARPGGRGGEIPYNQDVYNQLNQLNQEVTDPDLYNRLQNLFGHIREHGSLDPAELAAIQAAQDGFAGTRHAQIVQDQQAQSDEWNRDRIAREAREAADDQARRNMINRIEGTRDAIDREEDPERRKMLEDFLNRHAKQDETGNYTGDPNEIDRAINAVRHVQQAQIGQEQAAALGDADIAAANQRSAEDIRDWANRTNRALSHFVPGSGWIVNAQNVATQAVEGYEQGGTAGMIGRGAANLLDNYTHGGGSAFWNTVQNKGNLGDFASAWGHNALGPLDPTNYANALGDAKKLLADGDVSRAIGRLVDGGLDAADARNRVHEWHERIQNIGKTPDTPVPNEGAVQPGGPRPFTDDPTSPGLRPPERAGGPGVETEPHSGNRGPGAEPEPATGSRGPGADTQPHGASPSGADEPAGSHPGADEPRSGAHPADDPSSRPDHDAELTNRGKSSTEQDAAVAANNKFRDARDIRDHAEEQARQARTAAEQAQQAADKARSDAVKDPTKWDDYTKAKADAEAAAKNASRLEGQAQRAQAQSDQAAENLRKAREDYLNADPRRGFERAVDSSNRATTLRDAANQDLATAQQNLAADPHNPELARRAQEAQETADRAQRNFLDSRTKLAEAGTRLTQHEQMEEHARDVVDNVIQKQFGAQIKVVPGTLAIHADQAALLHSHLETQPLLVDPETGDRVHGNVAPIGRVDTGQRFADGTPIQVAGRERVPTGKPTSIGTTVMPEVPGGLRGYNIGDDSSALPIKGTVVHERLHAATNPEFQDTFQETPKRPGGSRLTEGLTEHFAQQVTSQMPDQSSIHWDRSGTYAQEVSVVRSLQSRVGEDNLRNAYFQGDVDSLHRALGNRMGITDPQQATNEGRSMLREVNKLMSEGKYNDARALIHRFPPDPNWRP